VTAVRAGTQFHGNLTWMTSLKQMQRFMRLSPAAVAMVTRSLRCHQSDEFAVQMRLFQSMGRARTLLLRGAFQTQLMPLPNAAAAPWRRRIAHRLASVQTLTSWFITVRSVQQSHSVRPNQLASVLHLSHAALLFLRFPLSSSGTNHHSRFHENLFLQRQQFWRLPVSFF